MAERIRTCMRARVTLAVRLCNGTSAIRAFNVNLPPNRPNSFWMTPTSDAVPLGKFLNHGDGDGRF